MSKHTPGPWKVASCSPIRTGHCVLGQQVWGRGGRVAFTERQNVGIETETANARLIAAAPDYDAAARYILTNGYDQKAIDMLRAAIAKVTGDTDD